MFTDVVFVLCLFVIVLISHAFWSGTEFWLSFGGYIRNLKIFQINVNVFESISKNTTSII